MDETIRIGGKDFVVPPLSARRIIAFSKLASAMGTINPTQVSEQQMIAVYEALLVGLQQGTPLLTLDEVLDMPIPFAAALDGVKIVAKQAGLGFEEKNPQKPAEDAPSQIPPASSANGTGSLQRS